MPAAKGSARTPLGPIDLACVWSHADKVYEQVVSSGFNYFSLSSVPDQRQGFTDSYSEQSNQLITLLYRDCLVIKICPEMRV